MYIKSKKEYFRINFIKMMDIFYLMFHFQICVLILANRGILNVDGKVLKKRTENVC